MKRETSQYLGLNKTFVMKKSFTILSTMKTFSSYLLLSFFTLAHVFAQTPIEEVHYMFNSSCADSSGVGNHGTPTMVNYAPDIAGIANSAADMNGTTSYIKVPSSFITPTTYQIGFSVWFKTDSNAAPSGLAWAGISGVGSFPTNFTPIMWIDSLGQLNGYIYDGNLDPMGDSRLVNDNQWHHAIYMASFSLLSGTVTQTLRLDGYISNSRAGSLIGVPSFDSLYIGTCNPRGMNILNSGGNTMADAWNSFNGLIDDAIFYTGTAGPEYFHFLDFAYTSHPASQTLTTGVAANLFVAHTYFNPDSSYTYQWYKNGSPISGETDSTFTIASTVQADSGTYHCETYNSIGDTFVSRPAILTLSGSIGFANTTSLPQFSLYPNPGNNLLIVDAKAIIEGEVILYSINGQEMLRQNILTKTELNTEKLNSGMYFVCLKTKEGTTTNQRWIKN